MQISCCSSHVLPKRKMGKEEIPVQRLASHFHTRTIILLNVQSLTLTRP